MGFTLLCYTALVRGIDKTCWSLAVLSGVLQVLVFPSPGLDWLGWIAIAPLIVAVLGARRPGVELLEAGGRDLRPLSPGAGFLVGYVSGAIWYGGSCYWIFHVMHLYGGLSSAISAGILVLFCLYLGLYHGLFGCVLAFLAHRRATGVGRALLVAPFLWVAVELARARITGFPWDLLGTAQVNNVPLSRIATFTGVYGISFEMALINTTFAAAFLVPARRRIALFLSAIAAAALLQAGTLIRLRPLPTTRVATLVQQNLPILDSDSWTPEFFDRTMADLARISVPAVHDAERMQGVPGLIVWPESPAPFFATDPRFRRAVSALAERADAYVVAGSLGLQYAAPPERAPVGQAGAPPAPPQLYNSAALIGPNGDFVARYDKVHLVPWGEYVPFKTLFSFAQKLTREVGDFTPGAQRRVLDLGEYKLGVFICYESIFPDEIREFAARGAQLLVNVSNDGWFGESGAPGQHLNMARMRAIENRRWLLRATNTGITVAVDPYGRIVARAPRNQRLALQAPYGLVSDQTFYTRYGDWFAWTCVVISMAGLIVRIRTSGPLTWSRDPTGVARSKS